MPPSGRPAVPATPTITPANAQDVASVAASLGSLLDLNGEALALIQRLHAVGDVR